MDGYFEIFHPKVNTVSYICKGKKSECIIRVQNLLITSRDIWYLWLIMVKSAVISFEDALTDHDHDIRYSSLQAAAGAKGFVAEINRAKTSLAREMRGLFASMAINGFPTIRIFEDNDLMMKDYIAECQMTKRNISSS